MSGREQILGTLRAALARNRPEAAARATLDARLSQHPRGIVPDRSRLPPARQVDLFCQWAGSVSATIARVDAAGVPGAVADYLASMNLPPKIVMANSDALRGYDWKSRPLLEIRTGLPEDADQVGLTGAFAGVAETGTLIMTSGPAHATSLNLLPETHIVVLREGDIVGSYEDVWDRLRTRYGAGSMPRTVNTITGPSRTADIEQTLQLGAHGPRRMHIVIVRD